MCTLWTGPYDRQLSKLEVCTVLSRQKAEKQSIKEWTVLLLRVKGCRHHSRPPIASAISTPQDLIMNCVFLSDSFLLLYCGLGLSAYQGCFHSINMKENIFSATQEHERASARHSKFKQIRNINTESNKKNILQLGICMLAVVVFYGWNMRLSVLK